MSGEILMHEVAIIITHGQISLVKTALKNETEIDNECWNCAGS